jgi:MFS family permease
MEEKQEASRSAKRFAGIEIPSELKWSHFFNLYVASLLMACIMSIASVIQPAFLKEIIKIPEEQAGSINSGLQNMSQVAMLLFVGAVGILSDKVGRRVLAILGFLVCGVFYIVFAYTKDISIVMGITDTGGQIVVTYIIRFIIGIGLILAWPQFITMVADYTSPRDRGKGMALHGVMMGLGSILVFGVIAQVARRTGLMSLFYMAGAIGFAGLIVTRLGLTDRLPKEKAKQLGIREIFRVVSKSLALKVSYVATFLIRVDINIITVFVIVWMVYAGEALGMSAVKATAKGGMVMLVMSVASMAAYPIMGVLLDRWGRVPVLVMTLIGAGVGFGLMALTKNPFSATMYFSVSLAAVGFGGASLASTTLAADASPKPLLGSILGGLNTMQPIGFLFFLQLGGFLYDSLGAWGPFAMKAILDGGCGLWILAIRKGIVIPKEEGVAHG